LASARPDGSYQDAFRSRLMMPIRDARGNIVGFGGRILGDGGPKYLNTAESRLFSKKYLLYGLDAARETIKKTGTALVVEGYMDAITLHGRGFSQTVASLGTAFAREQARLLARTAREVIFCYDSDQAGREAAVRAISTARREGLRVRALSVPDAKDPDEFILKFGAEKFSRLLATAPDGFTFQKRFFLAQTDFSTLAGKVSVVSNILPMIAELENSLEIGEHILSLAQDLTIDEAIIREEFTKFLRKSRAPSPWRAGTGETVYRPGRDALYEAQKQLVWAALKYSGLTAEIGRLLRDNSLDFIENVFKNIFAVLKKRDEEDLAQEEVLALLAEEEKAALAEAVFKEPEDADVQQMVKDCVKHLKKAVLEKQYHASRSLAAEYERAGDERVWQELENSRKIKEEMKNLFRPTK
jgi:DNA primase